MKIYLIGMPGSGKTTLGKALAQGRGDRFIDLDVEIVKNAGKGISDIFREEGEQAFRQMESDILRDATMAYDSFVMSTGGGAPCFHDNLDFMKASGITLYLKVSAPELESRLKQDKDSRPLLADSGNLIQKINDLLFKRESFYNMASFTIESDSISLLDLETAILKVKPHGKH